MGDIWWWVTFFQAHGFNSPKKKNWKKNNDYSPGFGKNSDFEWFIVWLKKEIEA